MDLYQLGASAADATALSSFYYDLYEAQFPDPDCRESLENMRNALQAARTGPDRYHVLLGYEDGGLIAGCVGDYLSLANTGMVEFLVVAPSSRRKGHGRTMLEEMIRLFHADAVHAGRKEMDYIMGEMQNPGQAPSQDVDDFRFSETSAIWRKLGFHALDFPYVQPALDPSKSPVRDLLLIARPLTAGPATDVAPHIVQKVVGAYMRWAMRIAHPELNLEYREMLRHLEGVDRVRLLPL